MREHVSIGARILENGSSEIIRTAELIAGRATHERWDGKGYPDRLSGPDIPVEARVVALADVFDALCSPSGPTRPPGPSTRPMPRSSASPDAFRLRPASPPLRPNGLRSAALVQPDEAQGAALADPQNRRSCKVRQPPA